MGAAPKDGFHVLRHTCAPIMLEAGEPVVTVARWLGHSSPAITLGYYAHFMPEAGSKGRTVIDGLLGRQGDLPVGRNSPDSPQGCRRGNPAVSPLRSRSCIARLKRLVAWESAERGRRDPLHHAVARGWLAAGTRRGRRPRDVRHEIHRRRTGSQDARR
ncbi:tyrosine-type recombinase/integrase [Streptomyces sp. NBC_00328]|uniref:tyrosine-type recombinase/integrase n=1 Tax=Streptomyces sp. NBC_00328 TaxID=2903646 RepID=UPI003FA692CC